jgi:molybdate transport system regulatory protein
VKDAGAGPELRPRLRLMRGKAIAVGPGKADLLAAIAETGSIAAAGRRLGMSYKRAWYLLDTMNRCFCAPVVQANKGGRGRGGAVLTPTGARVLALYRALEACLAKAGRAELAALEGLLKPAQADAGQEGSDEL